jgi:hypothetical protein
VIQTAGSPSEAGRFLLGVIMAAGALVFAGGVARASDAAVDATAVTDARDAADAPATDVPIDVGVSDGDWRNMQQGLDGGRPPPPSSSGCALGGGAAGGDTHGWGAVVLLALLALCFRHRSD